MMMALCILSADEHAHKHSTLKEHIKACIMTAADISIFSVQEKDDSSHLCQHIETLCFPEKEALNIASELTQRGVHVFFAGDSSKGEDDCQGYVLLQKTTLSISIKKIVVMPTSRRQGIGRRLLQSVTEFATEKHIGVCSLNVEETNIAAIDLYKSEGFSETVRRRDFYAIGRHALHMEKVMGEA